MSISLSVSEVCAIVSSSHLGSTSAAKGSSRNASLRVNAEWRDFKKAYDRYVSDPQATTFVELRSRLRTLKEAIRSFDKALAESTSK